MMEWYIMLLTLETLMSMTATHGMCIWYFGKLISLSLIAI